MPMASFQDDSHKYNSLVIFFFLMCYLSNLIFDLQLGLPTSCIEADFFFFSEPETLGEFPLMCVGTETSSGTVFDYLAFTS